MGKPYNKLLTSLACSSLTEKNWPSVVVFFTDLITLSPECYDLRPIILSMTLMGLVSKKLTFNSCLKFVILLTVNHTILIMLV